MKIIEIAIGNENMAGLRLAHTAKEFRRGMLSCFVEPEISLMNRFLIEADEPPLAWVQANEEKFGASFFGALWLAAKGAMPVFSVPQTEIPATSMVRHENAPDSANHVIAKKQTEEQIAHTAGEILGWLIAVWSGRVLESRSLQSVLDSTPHLMPEGTLTEPVLSACSELVGELVQMIPENTEGSIAFHYVLDAILAILCKAYKCTNPRQKIWTQIQFVYDYMRRQDGNDESILLPPEVVRATIDEAEFWRFFEGLGKHLGFSSITEESRDKILVFFEAMTRLFPEGNGTQPIAISLSEDLGDNEAIEKLRSLLEEAIGLLPDMNLLNFLFAGFKKNRRELLPSFVNQMVELLNARNDIGADIHSLVLRCSIEWLNNCGHKQEAMNIAKSLRDLIEGGRGTALPIAVKAHCYNEIGNCYRYISHYAEAMACYELALDFLGRNPKDVDVRIGLRNRAIILRDTHRFSEARKEFAALVPFSGNDELRGLVLSEALCIQEMGMLESALDLMEKHIALIEGRHAANPHVLEYFAQITFLRLQLGKLDEIAEYAQPLLKLGQQYDYFPASLTSALITVEMAAHTQDVKQLENALFHAFELVEMLVGHPVIPTVALHLIGSIDRFAEKAGQADRSATLIVCILKNIDPEKTIKGWILPVMLARHFQHSSLDDVVQLAEMAFEYLDIALWEVTRNEDAQAVLAPQSGFLDELARLTFELSQIRPDFPRALLRLAADLRASPVLSTRLRHRANLPHVSYSLQEEDERLVRLLQGTPAVVIQFMEIKNDVLVVLTKLNSDSKLCVETRPLGIDIESLRKLNAQLRFSLRNSDPTALTIDLRRVSNWGKLECLLQTCINDILPDMPLFIVAGAVGEAAISIAVGNRPLCFVPSVSGLIALREQRRLQFQDLGWVVERWFDFATWFEEELPTEANSLANITNHGAERVAAHKLIHLGVSGKDANEGELLKGLEVADVARIACHGRYMRGAESIDLLVAADGFLPPANLLKINNSNVHVVSWEKLAALEKVPFIVFSTACDSGTVIVTDGGERLGLERPLFLAGNLLYIAPLWPVPTVAVQDFMTKLIDRWLDDMTRPLAAHLAELRSMAVANGTPQLATAGIVIFGDGI